MIASVHVADVGRRAALGILRKEPRVGRVDGLRWARIATPAPLGGSVRPSPQFGRVALVAFWDDDDALDAFLATDALAPRLADGWRVRLDPIRRWGTWPGLPDDVPTERGVQHGGPLAVLTLGRLRLSQAARFFRTSAKAEARVVSAPGLVWATGLARPPSFVATCSLWESTRALSTYAYGRTEPEHADAIAAHDTEPFHHESAFIRFRPYGSEGGLEGKNPLAPAWMTASAADES